MFVLTSFRSYSYMNMCVCACVPLCPYPFRSCVLAPIRPFCAEMPVFLSSLQQAARKYIRHCKSRTRKSSMLLWPWSEWGKWQTPKRLSDGST